MKQVLPHPFMKLLHDLWPFGEDFKDLGIGGKIYEIVKVQCNMSTVCTVYMMYMHVLESFVLISTTYMYT